MERTQPHSCAACARLKLLPRVLALATRLHLTRVQMACAGAFTQERNLYTDPSQPLGRFLPQMVRIAEGTDSGLRDAQGAVMAPCIVMEKGEALDVWIKNSGEKIDMFTGLQAHPPPSLYHALYQCTAMS